MQRNAGWVTPGPQRILEISTPPTTPATWLIRIPEVFADWEPDIIRELGAESLKKLAKDYQLVRLENPDALHHSEAAGFVSWNLPIHHSWPCNPARFWSDLSRSDSNNCMAWSIPSNSALAFCSVVILVTSLLCV